VDRNDRKGRRAYRGYGRPMVVLVTGCRSGFGLLLAEGAARRGHVVYAGLRDPATDGELRERTRGLDVRPLALDVTHPAQRTEAVARILSEQGRIDALVNNAGTPLGGFLEEVGEDELRGVFEVNFFGVWLLTREVLPAMRAQQRGTIVMMSSRSGRSAFPALGTYASSKFALEGLSEAWRHELRPFGIDVYLVEPGPFKTDIWERNRRVSVNAFRPDGPYQRFESKLDATFKKVAAGARDPKQVVDRTLDLLGKRGAPLRHSIGGLDQHLFELLPFGVRERIVRAMLDE
jgi:NAD(P)-dependent dehydrogenase (short-subunit alcohol dehydrogenase family)